MGNVTSYKNKKYMVPDLAIPKTNLEEPTDYNKCEKVYFAFIDVLGFKRTYDAGQIKKQTDIIINNEPNKKYKDVFNYYFRLMQAAKLMQSKNLRYAGQTSDSLYFYTDRIDLLAEFLKIFSVFNMFSMSKDVFFRGGIAKGQLFTKESYQFYGDSVINAYLLESDIAKQPAIYVDEKTASDLLVELEKPENKKIKSILETDNKRKYIKPFNALTNNDIRDLLNDEIELEEFDLQKIGELISRNRQSFEFHPSTFAKYSFLEDKYNSFLKEQK